MTSVTARAARCLLALSLCAVGAGCAGASRDNVVNILVPWTKGTPEYAAFWSVVYPFAHDHGFTVNPEVSREPTQQLDADRETGDPPDLVDLPSPAAVYQYKDKGLKTLSTGLLKSYDQPWRGLAELGTHTVYAIPVKADVKGLIWYDKNVLRSPPTSWAALKRFSGNRTPWCLGLSSGSTSGWPGADWVAQILLSGSPAGTYENWLSGNLRWTSGTVENAWKTWGALMHNGAAIKGGVAGALNTPFGSAAAEMAANGCELEHGALSATGLTSPAHYGYVPFPPLSGAAASPIMVSGDFMGLFTDNPNARKLLIYLASGPAQTKWVKHLGAYAFSADHAVTPASYPAGVQQAIASLLQPADKTTMCFSAEDMMQSDMSAAFENAVLSYVYRPALLWELLNGLQRTQQATLGSPVAKLACARP